MIPHLSKGVESVALAKPQNRAYGIHQGVVLQHSAREIMKKLQFFHNKQFFNLKKLVSRTQTSEENVERAI